MAKRIIVATLYQGTDSNNKTVYLLNVTPASMTLIASDEIFLVVKKDSGVTGSATTFSGTFSYSGSFLGTSPITIGSSSNNFDTVIQLASVASSPTTGTYSYTLSITYNSQTFADDPKITINS